MDTTPQDVLTLPEMSRTLSADRDQLERARRALETAQATYRDATLRGRYFSDEAHAIALRDHLPALQSAEDAALRVAGAADRNAREIRRQTEGAVMRLEPEDAGRAAALLPLVQREVETLPLPALAVRIRAAISTGNTAAQYLYAETVPAWLKGDDPRHDSPEGQAAREMQRIVWQIRDALRDTSFDGIRAETDTALQRAGELRAKASARQRESAVHLSRDGRPKVAWPGR